MFVRMDSFGRDIMVYVFLADGFEEIEALTPVDLLRRAGVTVRTVSIYPDRKEGRQCTGSCRRVQKIH